MSFIPATEKKLRRKNLNLLDFRSDPESDQDPELDPDPLSRKRIRIRIKMQRIRNTAKKATRTKHRRKNIPHFLNPSHINSHSAQIFQKSKPQDNNLKIHGNESESF